MSPNHILISIQQPKHLPTIQLRLHNPINPINKKILTKKFVQIARRGRRRIDCKHNKTLIRVITKEQDKDKGIEWKMGRKQQLNKLLTKAISPHDLMVQQIHQLNDPIFIKIHTNTSTISKISILSSS